MKKDYNDPTWLSLMSVVVAMKSTYIDTLERSIPQVDGLIPFHAPDSVYDLIGEMSTAEPTMCSTLMGFIFTAGVDHLCTLYGMDNPVERIKLHNALQQYSDRFVTTELH